MLFWIESSGPIYIFIKIILGELSLSFFFFTVFGLSKLVRKK